jgi:hypothetical protein
VSQVTYYENHTNFTPSRIWTSRPLYRTKRRRRRRREMTKRTVCPYPYPQHTTSYSMILAFIDDGDDVHSVISERLGVALQLSAGPSSSRADSHAAQDGFLDHLQQKYTGMGTFLHDSIHTTKHLLGLQKKRAVELDESDIHPAGPSSRKRLRLSSTRAEVLDALKEYHNAEDGSIPMLHNRLRTILGDDGYKESDWHRIIDCLSEREEGDNVDSVVQAHLDGLPDLFPKEALEESPAMSHTTPHLLVDDIADSVQPYSVRHVLDLYGNDAIWKIPCAVSSPTCVLR